MAAVGTWTAAQDDCRAPPGSVTLLATAQGGQAPASDTSPMTPSMSSVRALGHSGITWDALKTPVPG